MRVARNHREEFRRNLKSLRCPACGVLFMQTSLAQFYCSAACREKPRPDPPFVQRTMAEFREFIKKHLLFAPAIVRERIWHKGKSRQINNKRPARERVAPQIAALMKNFRAGLFVIVDRNLVYLQPKLEKFCPIGHGRCEGAILPNDCPRQHPECLYSKTESWDQIFKARGIYETLHGQSGYGRVIGTGERPFIESRPATITTKLKRTNGGDGHSDDATTDIGRTAAAAGFWF